MASVETAENYSENFKEKHILPIILLAEMWERFSYYGMQALLALFLTKELNMPDSASFAVISIYISVCYAGPVFSGVIADKLLGAKAMVLIGGVILIIGHAAMAMVAVHHSFTFVGLGLISIGMGAFKGNITNLLGQVYENDPHKKDYAFTLFHVAVNFGGALAAIVCGYIGQSEKWGWHYGFGIAAVGMAIGLVIFASVKNTILAEYGNPPDEERASRKYFGINAYGMVFLGLILIAIAVMGMLQFAESFIGPMQILSLLVFASFIYVIWNYRESDLQFWSLVAFGIMLIFFMSYIVMELQIFSLLNVFIDRNVDKYVFGYYIPASVFQSIDPVAIIMFGWFLAQFFKKTTPEFAVPRIFIALAMMALSYYVIYLGCLNANSEGEVTWLIPVAAISLIGVSEIFIAPLIQLQATTLTPHGTRGFMIGITMISLSVASLGGYEISKLMALPSTDALNAKLKSLEVYKDGFFKVAILNTVIAIAFLPFYNFLKKAIYNNSNAEFESNESIEI
jgi:POT family proton-dependent oligopeptide transporter